MSKNNKQANLDDVIKQYLNEKEKHAKTLESVTQRQSAAKRQLSDKQKDIEMQSRSTIEKTKTRTVDKREALTLKAQSKIEKAQRAHDKSKEVYDQLIYSSFATDIKLPNVTPKTDGSIKFLEDSISNYSHSSENRQRRFSEIIRDIMTISSSISEVKTKAENVIKDAKVLLNDPVVPKKIKNEQLQKAETTSAKSEVAVEKNVIDAIKKIESENVKYRAILTIWKMKRGEIIAVRMLIITGLLITLLTIILLGIGSAIKGCGTAYGKGFSKGEQIFSHKHNVHLLGSPGGNRIGNSLVCYGDRVIYRKMQRNKKDNQLYYYIKTDGGKYGWVYAGRLGNWFRKTMPYVKQKQVGNYYRCCKNRANYINIRQRPSKNARVIGTVKKGDKVKIQRRVRSQSHSCAHYYQIYHKGKKGYIYIGREDEWLY